MVEIGEKYRHYKSTGGTDHTYEIMGKATFAGEEPADMSEVIVSRPLHGTGLIVTETKDAMGQLLSNGASFNLNNTDYTVTERGIFQAGTFTPNEEVIIYKPLYEIRGLPPHVSVIVRGTADFIGEVLINNQSISRFTRIE